MKKQSAYKCRPADSGLPVHPASSLDYGTCIKLILATFCILFVHQALAQTQQDSLVVNDLPDESSSVHELAAGFTEWELFGSLVFLAVAALLVLLLIRKFILYRTRKPLINLGYRYIALTLMFGLMVAILDAVLDSLFFYKGQTFWSLLILDVPAHEIYMHWL